MKRWMLVALGVAVVTSSPTLAQKKKSRSTAGARDRSEADAEAEAAAEKAREERESRVPTVVEEKAREKVETKDAPTLKLDDFARRDVELQVAAKRKELIDYLDAILAQNPPDTEKPELLFQKAELYLEESQFHFFEGMGAEDRGEVKQNEGDKAAAQELFAKRDAELAESKDWVRDAVLIYQEIEESYPQFERMPEVLYALGRAFWEVQSYRKALPVYRRIIKDFPKSQYVADAWLAFGEYYFELAPKKDRDVHKALNAYKEAAKFEDNPIFGYAIYKQGWCYYNLGTVSDYKTSAEKFKEVVLYSDLNADLLGTRRITLAREARKDYVLAYSHYGDPRQAKAEFEAIAPEASDRKKMLEKLGDIYYGDGKDRPAIIIYRELMKMDPNNTRNPLYQGKIVKLASRIGQKRQVVAHARKLVEEYKRVRDVFANTKEGSPDYDRIQGDLEAADEVSDNTLRFLATTWHNEAKKTRDDSTFEYAYELYGDYLDLFPKRKEAYEIRFFYAELLYRLEKFEQAGEQYLTVYQQAPKGKWAAASAEEAVRAYEEVVKDYNRANKPKPPSGPNALDPQPIPDVKKKFVAACNNYVENYPEGELVIEAKYRIARVLYDYNYFDKAVPRFLDIIKNHRTHARAEQSANLVLDTFNIREDWAGLNETAREFSKNKTLMKNDEFKTVLLQVLEESSFKLISDYEKGKEFEEAAKRYLAFADEFPKSALADKALANSAAMFSRAGQLDRAIKVRIKLINEYPDSPLLADQIFSVASSFEQIVDYRRAADWQEKFVEKYPKDPRSKDALYNASIYRQGVGQIKQAIEDREKYIKEYGQSKDAVDIAYSIPTAWEEAGKEDEAIDAYLAFAQQWRKKEPAKSLVAQYKAVRLLEDERGRKNKKRFEREKNNLRGYAKAYQRSGKPATDAAEPLGYLAFEDADQVFERFQGLQIAPPDNVKKFQKTLQDKRKSSEGVYEAYTKVVKLGDPEWAVASLYRIGMTHQHLVDAITAVPAPKGLTDEQSQLFADKLAEQTLPIEEKAADAMVLCLDESARFGVFNKWTRNCLSFLESRRPDMFPKNDLELRVEFKVDRPFKGRGNGLIIALPKKGQRAETDNGSAPPVPAPSTEPITVVREDKTKAAEPDGEGGEDGFDFDEGEI